MHVDLNRCYMYCSFFFLGQNIFLGGGRKDPYVKIDFSHACVFGVHM